MYNFREFIDHDKKIPKEEKENIHLILEEKENIKIMSLILILLVWSALSAVVESLLIGGGFISSLVHGSLSLRFFIPEFIFVALNFITKLFFIPRFMKGNIAPRYILYGAIPSVGPLILANIFVWKYKFFFSSLKKYARYRRRSFFRNFSLKKLFSQMNRFE
ncbi:MAG: hypothetical protein PHC89_02745 [Candidatus Pacebacteria bacterium]|nr:hypothetical protein [Candidatus Paceibacterota bacterium]